MVIARASGTDLSSSLKQNTLLTLVLGLVAGTGEPGRGAGVEVCACLVCVSVMQVWYAEVRCAALVCSSDGGHYPQQEPRYE